jgi:1,2-phenylacetyl-CoA epoxidase PaaB subunit
VNDEYASPLAGSIPQVNDENALQLAENVPPRRRIPENITLVRRSTRRATAALHGELTSVLEIQGAAILSSVRKSSVREMEDL